jgi:nucleoside-diphosphate-sugar epimerase
MRVFVTGASGFIGSAVTSELISNGHEIIGLARSDESAEAITKAGVSALRGSLEDLDILKKAASEADGVINLGFSQDMSNFAQSALTELKAIETIGEVLKKTNRPFVVASGGPNVSEMIDPNASTVPRVESALKAIELAKHGVRTSVVRSAQCVHDENKVGLIAPLVDIAKKTGVSGYIGDGSNHWSAVHRIDDAHLFCLAIENAPAGSVLQAVAEGAIEIREIAEKIGQHLNLPVKSIPSDEAEKHFGWLSRVIGADLIASSERTQRLINWHPTHPDLFYDMDHGHFFDNI